MFDFVTPVEVTKRDYYEVSFDFKVRNSKDLMIKGNRFYAIWDEENNIWTTDEFRAIEMIDSQLRDYISEKYKNVRVVPKYISSSASGSADKWKKYTTKLMPDNFKPFNTKVIFKSQDTKRSDHSSIRVDYDLEEGEPENYNKMFFKFFAPEELQKLEWAIGSILTGDSKKIQKFIVLYGDPGTGKSTYIDYVIKALFPGYYTEFTAKNLASGSDQFAMEPFKDNPLVAIQSDGDLSKVMDCTRLNSIVSHEEMVINEKHKSQYKMKVDSFLFMATNLPVDISSSRSGLNRRLIVVEPTGQKFSSKEYDKLIDKIIFEKGKIANKCIKVYKELGKSYYNSYVPTNMKKFTDEFYNFVEEDYYTNFKDSDYVRGVDIWNRYKLYCEKNNVRYPLSYLKFRTELYSYFKEFISDTAINGVHMRNVYRGFRKSKIGLKEEEVQDDIDNNNWIVLRSISSLLDDMLSDQPAQYGKEDGTPERTWSTVRTLLRDINTNELHYILVPINHIVIDFDLKDENGNKSLEKNMAAASKWPATYCEVSKGGQGLHLHYIYDGDPTQLRPVYEPGIEVKVFSGKSALRRRLSICNDIPVAHILNGLPLKEEKKVLNFEGFKNEKQIRKFIADCLEKKHHGATKPEVDFIFKALDDAYKSGLQYDLRDLRQKVYLFCLDSTNQKDACKIIFNKMKFYSKEYEEEELRGEVTTKVVDQRSLTDAPIIFLDIEVYPNLFLICWKFAGDDQKCVRMYNPRPEEVEELFKYRIIGYNNRRYDNHLCYAASMGYSNLQLFSLSQKIVGSKTGDAFIGEAYNLSYTDVYDFASTKQSLKKWEIELGIHHQEMDWPWDQPIPKEKWEQVGDYCCNDVIATEKVFNHLEADFVAREILADISGLTVNDTTNMHTMRIILGDVKNPQVDYIYTNLATGVRSDGTIDETSKFPGYIFDATKSGKDKSTYKGYSIGEGGRVYAEPGMYGPTIVEDIASQHPSSIEALNLFGPYTKNFSMLKQARIYIKHKEYDKAGELFGGKLKKWLTDDSMAKALSYALKIAINSVYGLTSAKFPNKLKDPRNEDNIVAKRGALFMTNLQEEVEKRGFTVAHIKTDSIKIPNYTDDICKFVEDYGKKYGYTFEVEEVFDRICLVNNAVYIAKYADGPHEFKLSTGEKLMTEWTATGAEFAHPYIFKTLFSHNDILFNDLCETKSVTTNMYLKKDDNLIFIGKVGSFVPMKHGSQLVAERKDKDGNVKYDSVTGTKDYLWMESEYVKENHLEDDIDYSYYDRLADEAKKHISQFGDFDAFVSGEPIVAFNEECPFDEGIIIS